MVLFDILNLNYLNHHLSAFPSSGERCQYQDECVDDEDCGRHGKCIDVEATTAPRKQCFCQAGFFGAGCSEGDFWFRAFLFREMVISVSHNFKFFALIPWSRNAYVAVLLEMKLILRTENKHLYNSWLTKKLVSVNQVKIRVFCYCCIM